MNLSITYKKNGNTLKFVVHYVHVDIAAGALYYSVVRDPGPAGQAPVSVPLANITSFEVTHA